MRVNLAVWLALIPTLALAEVRVERAESLVREAPAPLEAGDVLLGYRYADQHVAIASALDVRIAQAMILPGTSLELEIRRGGKTLAVTWSFGEAVVDVRADAESSPMASLDQAWVDAIAAKDWPAALQLRDEAMASWQGVAGEFARLRGAKALFEARDFAGCVAFTDAQMAHVLQPLLRAQLLEQRNHCIAWSDSGDWQLGAAALDQASELLTQAAPDSLLKARIDALRAQILSFSDGPKARAQIEAAIAIGMASCGRCEAIGVMFQQAGDVYSNLNAYHEAEQAYRESVVYARALQAEPDSLASRLRPLARTLRVLGHYDEAWEVASEALAAMRTSTMPESAQIPFLNGLGAIAANRGDFRRAAEQFRAALALGSRTAPDSPDLGNAHANYGWTLMQLGDLLAAEVELRQAQAVVSRYDTGINLAVVLGMLADLEMRRGNDEQALAILDDISAIHERVNADSLDHATMLIQRATLLERMGRDAEPSWQRALQIVDQQPVDNVLRAEPLTERAYALLRSGDPEAALAGFGPAAALLQQHVPDSLAQARTLHGMALARLALGQLDQASQAEAQALAIRARDVPQSATHAESLHASGKIAAARGDQATARAQLCQASEILDAASLRVGGDSLAQARFRSLYATIYRDCVQAQAHAQQPELAFAALERFRARGYRAALEASHFQDRPTLEAIALSHDEEEQATTRANDPTLPPEIRREARQQAAQIGARRAELLSQLSRELPAARAIDLASYQRQLQAGEGLLSFATSEHETIVFLLTAKRLQMVSVDISATALREAVEDLRKLLSPATAEQDWQARAAVLYRQLLGPFSVELTSLQTLRIAPDGPLHRLPFAALWNADQQRYLLATHQLIMADGIGTARASDPGADHERRLLAVGISLPPDGSPGTADQSSLRQGLSALPAVRAEINALAARAGTRRLLDAEATEARVRQDLAEADDLHFAVHAVLDPAHEMASALLLHPGSGEARDDGLLTLREIIAELRVPPGLVVLSACETAEGRELDGEGPLSFARAFSIAGASATVASLWPVNDRATAQLMTRFYRYRDRGIQPAEALRQAMLALANAKQPAKGPDQAQRGVGGLSPQVTVLTHHHPYYWASFQIWGS
ncbi:MAG: CHAT domain-containing protein [Lysobacterales bacterium]|nr:CHAT domain-containing protein [Xanthomonadales bacterium]MCB1611185.1 CHAT domain-containing protein [Xanthomonadales bacterium]